MGRILVVAWLVRPMPSRAGFDRCLGCLDQVLCDSGRERPRHALHRECRGSAAEEPAMVHRFCSCGCGAHKDSSAAPLPPSRKRSESQPASGAHPPPTGRRSANNEAPPATPTGNWSAEPADAEAHHVCRSPVRLKARLGARLSARPAAAPKTSLRDCKRRRHHRHRRTTHRHTWPLGADQNCPRRAFCTARQCLCLDTTVPPHKRLGCTTPRLTRPASASPEHRPCLNLAATTLNLVNTARIWSKRA